MDYPSLTAFSLTVLGSILASVVFGHWDWAVIAAATNALTLTCRCALAG